MARTEQTKLARTLYSLHPAFIVQLAKSEWVLKFELDFVRAKFESRHQEGTLRIVQIYLHHYKAVVFDLNTMKNDDD